MPVIMTTTIKAATSRLLQHIAIVFAALLAPALASGTLTSSAAAQEIVADLSSHHVSVEFDFSGANLTLFGAVVGKSALQHDKHDVVIVVQGPKASSQVRLKEKAAGIWINRQSQVMDDLPSFYAIVSNRPPEQFADKNLRKILRLNLNSVPQSSLASEGQPAEKYKKFSQAFVRLKKQKEHYVSAPYGVKFIGKHLFRAELRLPADVQTGNYVAKVNLIQGNKLIGQYDTRFDIRKEGLEGLVFRTAHEQPLLYGLLSVLLAVAAGLGAAYIFRPRTG